MSEMNVKDEFVTENKESKENLKTTESDMTETREDVTNSVDITPKFFRYKATKILLGVACVALVVYGILMVVL